MNFTRKMLIGALAATACSSQAMILTGFDAGYTGSASGTILSGQNGWFLPAVTGATDLFVFTHASNTLGFPANPIGGGSQFVGLNNPAVTLLGRAQINHAYETGANYISFDVCTKYSGTLPATQNVGSASLQDSLTQRFFIALFTWSDVATAAAWNMQINCYDALGTATNNVSPSAAFSNLALNNWYREEFVFDFSTNRILEAAITDLSTGVRTVVTSSTWYLTGGAAPTLPTATAFRLFVGGTTAGNTMGFDNLVVGPPAATNTSADVLGGIPFGGSLASLAAADNDLFFILNDENDLNGVLDVAAANAGGPTSQDIGFIIEFAATRSDLSLFVRLRNYVTNSWTTVSTAVSSLSDKQIQGLVPGAGAQHVSSSGEVKARLEFIPQADLESGDGWSPAVDRVSLFVD